MVPLGHVLLGASVFVGLYAYVLYPALLAALARGRAPAAPVDGERPLPPVTIVLPAFNEAHQIASALDSLLSLEYPPELRQILVVSDASEDGTDEIVAGYADRGVELLRMPRRVGKTAAENAALPHIRGEIVVNTDASVRLERGAILALARRFGDPSVGVASGRDVSLAPDAAAGNEAEAGYVGYEMAVRALETRVAGIVGSSGSLYAIRRVLHAVPVPPSLSRDFASALTAHEHGFRAVSVDDAICYVPRTSSLRREYRRKVRTMTRGMSTLLYKRHLLDPRRHGLFAWQLLSHKAARWAVPWAASAGLLALAILAPTRPWAAALLALALAGIALGAVARALPEGTPIPAVLSLPAFVLAGNLAAMAAALRVARGGQDPVWEPTRRKDTGPARARVPSVPPVPSD